jgi:AcrR family transcriptional regulator
VQRARSDEAKTVRFQAILSAAAELFDETGPALTLSKVAERCQLSRTTLYGYANTKEELLLLLTGAEVSTFFCTVTNSMTSHNSVGECASPPVADVVAAAVCSQPRLAPLLSLAATVFEANVSMEAALAWKLQLHDGLVSTGAALDSATGANDGSGSRFLLHTYAIVTGLHVVANPVPVAAQAIEAANLDALRIDFRAELAAALNALQAALLFSRTPDSQTKTFQRSTATRKSRP